MDTLLQKNIKEVIDQYPLVGSILDDFGIGCVPCSVGSCLLSDVVDIHGLTLEDEEKMFLKVAEAVFPGKEVILPLRERKEDGKEKSLTLSPPMRSLVDEHALIKRWVALIPVIAKNFDFQSVEDVQTIREGVDFITSYADRFHHAKEEDILFGYFDEEIDIIKVMHDDHRRARGHVKAIKESLETRNSVGIEEHLTAYGEILSEHIKKEDEILYPWMDRILTTSQVGEIFSLFNDVDDRFRGNKEIYETFIRNMELKFGTGR